MSTNRLYCMNIKNESFIEIIIYYRFKDLFVYIYLYIYLESLSFLQIIIITATPLRIFYNRLSHPLSLSYININSFLSYIYIYFIYSFVRVDL